MRITKRLDLIAQILDMTCCCMQKPSISISTVSDYLLSSFRLLSHRASHPHHPTTAQTSTETAPPQAHATHASQQHRPTLQPPSPPLSHPSQERSTSPLSNLMFPSKYYPEHSPRCIHIADICYPESYLRTPIYELPKWQGKPDMGEKRGM